MKSRDAKPADQVLADLRDEWRSASATDRKEIETVAEKIQMIDLVMRSKK